METKTLPEVIVLYKCVKEAEKNTKTMIIFMEKTLENTTRKLLNDKENALFIYKHDPK